MKCTNCGAELFPGARFCINCGATQGAAAGPARPQPYQAAQTAEIEFKGIGPRLVAGIIDMILYFLFAWFVASRVGSTSSSGFNLEGVPAVFTFLVWAAYFVLMEGYRGGTLGKLILGIRVVNGYGQVPGLSASLIRNGMRLVDFLPFFYILGILAVTLSKHKQRVGDRVAGTYLVSSRADGVRIV